MERRTRALGIPDDAGRPLMKERRVVAAPAREPAWEFPREEYEQRVQKARDAMSAERIDCLLISGDRNLRYFTGFYTQGWINPSRPRYFVLPPESDPVAILPSGQAVGFRKMSWVVQQID